MAVGPRPGLSLSRTGNNLTPVASRGGKSVENSELIVCSTKEQPRYAETGPLGRETV